MNNTTQEKRARILVGVRVAGGRRGLGFVRLGTGLPLVLCALSSGGASWAQGYGTGAAAGTRINPSSLPSSAAPGVARPGGGDNGLGGIYGTRGDVPITERKKYPLGPGDVISVTIERFSDYSSRNVVIPPDGRLSLPYFGTLKVTGKTAPELETILTGRINKRIRNPKISVSIERFRSAILGYVNVLGAVPMQGQVEIVEGSRLADIMAKVGGVRGRYDEVEAVLSRGKKRIPIDLEKVMSAADGPDNIEVKARDVLHVKNVNFGRITVLGDVARQGKYDLRKAPSANEAELPLKPRLSDLVAAVGGFINNDKLLNGPVTGFVQRGEQRIELRVSDAIDFKDEAANIPLKAGDFVTFAVQLPLPINVLGLVRTPGVHRVPPGSGVLEATTSANGIVGDPLRTKATLQRNGNVREINMARLLAGDPTENLPLKAGDTINLTSTDTLQVAIAGAVSEPSKGEGLPLPTGGTISDAIARAGGIRTGLQPDRVSITIIRTTPAGRQVFLSVDPVALQERNDPSQNVALQNGDIINVLEKRSRTASILGEVARTGPYPVDEDGVDLVSFFVLAGGVRDTALLRGVKIKSADGAEKTVDAYEAVTNGRGLNVQVKEGDLVVVPRNQASIQITGAVRAPGPQPLPEGKRTTVLEALGRAGDPLPGARTQEVLLVRQGPGGPASAPITKTLVLNELGKGNWTGARTLVQDGDVIVVPEGKVRQDTISRGIGIFSALNLFRGFLR